jgi:hypothetical protein
VRQHFLRLVSVEAAVTPISPFFVLVPAERSDDEAMVVSAEAVVALASPARIKYIVNGRKELEKGGRLFEGLNLGYELARNLRQLCGYDMAPHGARNKADKWGRIEDVQYLYRDEDDTLVAVVGFKKEAGWIANYLPELAGQTTESSLKNVLNGSRPHIKGWKKWEGAAPAAAMELGDGMSLVGLKRIAAKRDAAPQSAVDFGQLYPNLLAPVSTSPIRTILPSLPRR